MKKGKRRYRKPVNAKKHVYNGIEFQSGLEVDMYKMLKKAKIKFDYEPRSYELIPSFTLNGDCYERAQKRSKEMGNKVGRVIPAATYRPDFVAKDESWIIETKGRKLNGFSIRWKLFQRLIQSWDPVPMLFMPTNLKDCEQVIEILKNKE